MADNELIDYTTGTFTLPVITADAKGYASVHANLYRDEDGLDFTGTYFVYLLHPVMGVCKFNMEFDEEIARWITRDAMPWVANELILQIADEIVSRTT